MAASRSNIRGFRGVARVACFTRGAHEDTRSTPGDAAAVRYLAPRVHSPHPRPVRGLAAAGGDPNNGWASVLAAVESMPADERAERDAEARRQAARKEVR